MAQTNPAGGHADQPAVRTVDTEHGQIEYDRELEPAIHATFVIPDGADYEPLRAALATPGAKLVAADRDGRHLTTSSTFTTYTTTPRPRRRTNRPRGRLSWARRPRGRGRPRGRRARRPAGSRAGDSGPSGEPEPPAAALLLRRAEWLVLRGPRSSDYGPPVEAMRRIAGEWSHLSDRDWTGRQVALHLAALKLARLADGHHDDSLVDLAGYALIAALCAEAEEADRGR